MELVPLCTFELSVEPPLQFGKTPTGQRSMSDISDVKVTGRITGRKVGTSAADWLVLNGDIGIVDVRLVLETDDGVLIGVRYGGKLDVSDPANRASRVSVNFDTGDERYRWLARAFVVGKSRLERHGDNSWTVYYDMFECR